MKSKSIPKKSLIYFYEFFELIVKYNIYGNNQDRNRSFISWISEPNGNHAVIDAIRTSIR